MTLLQEELPPLDISPVQLQIHIFERGREYTVFVEKEGSSRYFTIQLTPDDVKNLNTLLRGAIQQVANSVDNDLAYKGTLTELAKMGSYAFDKIFQDEEVKKTIHEGLQPGTIVQITSKDFFVPWELLYDGPLEENIDISYFWGIQYIISRVIPQNKRKGAFAPTVLASTRPRVGLIAYDRLPYVAQIEIPRFRAFHDAEKIQLDPLRKLSTQQRALDMIELKRFLAQELHVIHFACHAFEDDPIEKSYLFVSEDFALSMIDCSTSKFELVHNPFIFLNACLTGQVDPLYTSSWAGKFWELGARGVLGTDFAVPDSFAAAFSDVLYQYLLQGFSVGEALIKARRQFWTDKHKHNPLGLAYALYSSPSIKFVDMTAKAK